ncbi:methionyl-tRNA formyltransferase [Geitlerinema calcuttense]|uniref:Methionyl-tRNA formyltransferase n=1 Tax=Geitlerinema calcuttense NRMC-F 0142 TaxID=2922238 RepID=A0ABT7M1Q9_9CYAN|nr:methionyl-tRNA formyltransferase [Geitlerinema calcuttense]MDL5057782.1 methionyl-tRNA formyltransferase [Geitlerinema calcuttense NRMC-F 0142]
MKLVFFGTPDFAVPTLEKLLSSSDFQVLGVVTQPDKRRGRGNALIPSPVKTLALTHQLPIWQPDRIKKDSQTLSELAQLNADAFVVVAYGQILSPAILEMPRLGCINVHGSILPKYRGAAPIQWSIYRGETQTGITTMLMDAGMDTGAMLLKEYTPIHLFDTAHDIAQRLANLGADLLVQTLWGLEREEIQPIPQNSDEATYAPLIQKADYQLDWSKTAIALHNQIRAFFPNAVTGLRGQSLKIMATAPLDPMARSQLPPELNTLLDREESLLTATGQPGEIVGLIKGWGPAIQTGEGLLLLQQVQLAGKKPQSGWDLVNGVRANLGELLASSQH